MYKSERRERIRSVILVVLSCTVFQFLTILITVADPYHQIRGGGGGGHPDPKIRGGRGRSPKIFFRPFGRHFGRKIREGGGLPWIRR